MFNQFALIAADSCNGLLPIVKIVRKGVFPIVQIGIPILLILMGTIDMGRAVIASDEKEIKAAQSRLIKRVIYAIVVFFMVTLVTVVMNIVATADSDDVEGATSWRSCWNAAGN